MGREEDKYGSNSMLSPNTNSNRSTSWTRKVFKTKLNDK